ncbi:MAG: ATP-binding protein [Nitrosopumilus sp.]|nr:AAA family ATPase [Nitrosopumilus sp.]NRA05941.1 ATP-binding protein [Nitrosopumilus sp.]
METVYLESKETSRTKKNKPVVIHWGKNKAGDPAKLVRSHSLRSTVAEILQFSSRLGMVRINIIGASGSGKTSLAESIAHLCHSMSMEFTKIPYEVKFMQKEDLIDFTSTIQNLSSNNYVLVFDDLSWMGADFSKKQIEKLKAEITTIRHIDGNSDRKMIVIFNSHAQKVMDKFLRIANFIFYSSCSSEEVTYLLEMLGKKYHQKIDLFRRLRIQAMGQGKFHFPLGKNNAFTYKAFDPFLPYLFSNGDFVRFVVSPLRTWIQEDCQICEVVVESTKTNIDDFVNDYSKKFGKGISKRAIELKLLQHGITCQPKRVLQAQKYIEKFLSMKKVNLLELADRYGLEEQSTHLPKVKQPDV